jgi:hypothetical protein
VLAAAAVATVDAVDVLAAAAGLAAGEKVPAHKPRPTSGVGMATEQMAGVPLAAPAAVAPEKTQSRRVAQTFAGRGRGAKLRNYSSK